MNVRRKIKSNKLNIYYSIKYKYLTLFFNLLIMNCHTIDN